jgi:penicillin-binding protein 1B
MTVRAGARRWLGRVRWRNVLAVCAILVVLGIGLISLEAVAVARLEDRAISAPSRIYARAPILQRGMRPDREAVEAHLLELGYTAASRRSVGTGEFYLGQRLWVIGRSAFRHGGRVEPAETIVVRMGFGGSIGRLEDESGGSLPYATLEPILIGHLSAGGQVRRDRIPVGMDHVPEYLVNAVLTIEDRRFYDHNGLDPRRIAGAALANIRAGRIVQGGSTITQQLARSLFLSRKRTLLRKAREAAIAIVLESRYDKDEILAAYFNEVYLGQDGAFGVHGVGSAARHFFGKDVGELDLPESALLAGLIRAPSLYSPFRQPDAAIARRDFVLDRMAEQGVISEQERNEAAERLLALRQPRRTPRGVRYFTDYLTTRLEEDLGEDAIETGGMAVLTALDLGLQRAAERAVDAGLAQLESRYAELRREASPTTGSEEAVESERSEAVEGQSGPRLQAALVAIDPRTGEILAMVGGRDYGTSQFNRAVQARRQPGSAFKPVVALAALADRSGAPGFTLASVLENDRLIVETRQGPWQPVNYDGEFGEPVTLREALELSLNVPFARLGLAVGPEGIVEAARNLGVESSLMPVPSLALGASEVSLLELTRAYGVLAAEGFRADPLPYYGALGPDGSVIRRLEGSGVQAYKPAETYLVTSALRGAVQRGTGRSLRALGFDGDVAAKSGTTNGYRDGWFVGYAPGLAVGVWVGFDDGASLGLPGARVALPIFARFLLDAVGRSGTLGSQGGYEFAFPDGLEIVEVDPETGLRAGPGCRGEPELFLEGTAPRESCSRWGTWLAEAARVLESEGRWRGDLDELRRELRQALEREARVESEQRSGRRTREH